MQLSGRRRPLAASGSGVWIVREPAAPPREHGRLLGEPAVRHCEPTEPCDARPQRPRFVQPAPVVRHVFLRGPRCVRAPPPSAHRRPRQPLGHLPCASRGPSRRGFPCMTLPSPARLSGPARRSPGDDSRLRGRLVATKRRQLASNCARGAPRNDGGSNEQPRAQTVRLIEPSSVWRVDQTSPPSPTRPTELAVLFPTIVDPEQKPGPAAPQPA